MMQGRTHVSALVIGAHAGAPLLEIKIEQHIAAGVAPAYL
jgi:hypothetical protein